MYTSLNNLMVFDGSSSNTFFWRRIAVNCIDIFSDLMTLTNTGLNVITDVKCAAGNVNIQSTPASFNTKCFIDTPPNVNQCNTITVVLVQMIIR